MHAWCCVGVLQTGSSARQQQLDVCNAAMKCSPLPSAMGWSLPDGPHVLTALRRCVWHRCGRCCLLQRWCPRPARMLLLQGRPHLHLQCRRPRCHCRLAPGSRCCKTRYGSHRRHHLHGRHRRPHQRCRRCRLGRRTCSQNGGTLSCMHAHLALQRLTVACQC
jgi:hypothetical protein